MENKENEFTNNEDMHSQQVSEQIPEINSIPPMPDIGQNTSQNSKGFHASHTDYENKQEQNSYLGNSGENKNYQPNQNNSKLNSHFMQINIPNSGGILALGILSIISLCCCVGFLSPILSIIALAMIPKAKRAYSANPQLYKVSSLNNLKAGKITAIIGLSLAAMFIIYLIFATIVGNFSMNDVNEAINEAWNETGY